VPQRFIYKSSVGVLEILQDHDGRWMFCADDVVWGHYNTPAAAADDVYTQHTGFDAWDDLDDVDEPCDLSEWTRA
jgi:hypothetical protein